MNIETKILEDYVNCVDHSLPEHANFVNTTTKHNTYFKRISFFFAIIITLFLVFLLLKYLNVYTFSLDQTAITGDLNAV